MTICFFALLLALTVQAGAEEAGGPAAGHTEDHPVRELLREETATPDESGQGHTLRLVYDLYCEECQRVVQPGIREETVFAPHEWTEEQTEPTCEEEGCIRRVCALCGLTEEIILPPLGHVYGDIAHFIKQDAGEVLLPREGEEPLCVGTVIVPSTCTKDGQGTLICLRCQGEQPVVIPSGGHSFGDWQEAEIPQDQQCTVDRARVRVCADCQETETETMPAPGHQWQVVSYSEPTCTQNGVAVRQCARCQQQERLETPAMGHCYTWVEVSAPTQQSDGVREYRCVICGDVAQTETIPHAEMLYNNTITAFGPTTRELIGGSVWNRVTPIDLSTDGVYTYPLVASNRYTVGTATVTIESGTQVVSYQLSSPEVQIHSESLIIYPSLKALRTGENAVSFAFNQPIDSAQYFGDDPLVILGITLKADYNILADGVQYFTPDEAQIQAMTGLID